MVHSSSNDTLSDAERQQRDAEIQAEYESRIEKQDVMKSRQDTVSYSF